MKPIFLIVGYFLLLINASAQTKPISGYVKNMDGKPIAGCHINPCNLNIASTQSNTEGYFIFEVPDTITYLTFRAESHAETQKINSSGRYKLNTLNIDEVVVSALQIPMQKRAAGYSIQCLSVDEIKNESANLLQKINGTIPGAYIQNSGGAPGQSVRMVLRGNKSLDPLAENQPAFVLNGMPIDNSTLAGFGSGESFAFSNRLIDLNINDLSDITVLKGASASSLYGMQAANGAVLIKTKQAKEPGFHIQLNSGVTIDKVTQFPEQQMKYMAGWYGKPKYLTNDFPFHAFGPLADTISGATFYNNLKNFFQEGVGFHQNLILSSHQDRAECLLSISNLNQNGVIPTTSMDRNTVMVQAGYEFTPKFRIEFFNHFSHLQGTLVPQGNESEITSGAMAQLYYYPTSIDVRDDKKNDGTMNTYTPWVKNPLYLAKHYHLNNTVNRNLTSIQAKWQIAEKTTIQALFGMDAYSDIRKRVLPGAQGTIKEVPLSAAGEMQKTTIDYRQLYSQFSISHTIATKNGSLHMTLGNELIDKQTDMDDVLGQRFVVSNYYNINNTEDQRYLSSSAQKRNAALYGSALFCYKDYWYTTVTGRQEWSSTLPVNHRTFFYPSISTSLILSDIDGIQKLAETIGLNTAQLRLSYAQAGKDARPYQTGSYYEYYDNFNSNVAYSKYSNIGSGNLKPERTHSMEIGCFMSFFNHRLSTDITFYHILSNNLLMGVPISEATGYKTYTTNAGSIVNQGIEWMLTIKPIAGQTFNWTSTWGFSKNWNEVTEIANNIGYIELPGTSYMYGGPVSIRLEKGSAYGNIYGTSQTRYQPKATGNQPDKNAPLLIDTKGFPVVDYQPKCLGNIQPDYIVTALNTLQYKRISFACLFEYKKGGDVFNQAEAFFAAQGTSMATLDRDQTRLFSGVTAAGDANTQEVWLGQGIQPSTGVDYGDGYYRNVYRKVAENFIEDASWVKLRDAHLSFASSFRSKYIRKLTFTAGITNLIVWTPFKGFDPEASQMGAGSNTQGFQGRGNPSVSSFYMGLNIELK